VDRDRIFDVAGVSAGERDHYENVALARDREDQGIALRQAFDRQVQAADRVRGPRGRAGLRFGALRRIGDARTEACVAAASAVGGPAEGPSPQSAATNDSQWGGASAVDGATSETDESALGPRS
jgi:hypothetical protein